MKKLISVILSAVLLLSGCGISRNADAGKKCRVVTGITIQYKNGTEVVQRHYSDQHKMRKVLTYLRWLDPWDIATPDAVDEPMCEIRLDFSDGSMKHYAQKSHSYIRTDDGPWKEIDPDKGIRLPLLLAAIPSDAAAL